MGGILIKIRAWWETADRTQRVVSIFGSAFLILLLGSTFYFATRPKMNVVASGLEPAQMGRVVEEVQGLGIPVEYDTVSGTVRVPEDKSDEVRTKLAMAGLTPTSSHAIPDALDKMPVLVSEPVEKARLINIQQNEIARVLEGLDYVQSVNVILNPGERGGFASQDIPASASVTVTAKPGYEVTPENAQAMASLVSRAVTNLAKKDVTIVDSTGLTLYDGSQEGSYGTANKKLSAEIAEARRIRAEIQPVLDRWCGPGMTIVTARVTMDFDQTKEDSVVYKRADDPGEVSEVKETVGNADGQAAGGGQAAGAPANLGGTNTQTNGGNDKGNNGYVGSQKNEQYRYNETRTQKEKAQGAIKNVAISVVVNTAPPKPAPGQKPEDVPQPPSKDAVEQFLNGHLGLVKNANGEYQTRDAAKDAPVYAVTVVESAFRPSDSTATQAAASVARTQQIFSLLPIAALFIVAIVVLKAIAKVAKSRDILVTATGGGNFLPGMGAAALTMGSRQLAPLADGETDELADDETWVEEDDPETNRPVRKKKKKVDVGEIDEKVNIPLEQIRKLTEERPDTVALLLKSWLTEERR